MKSFFKKLSVVIAAVCVVVSIPVFSTDAHAALKYVELEPVGYEGSNADFNNISYYTEEGGYHIKLAKGTYYINGQLRLNSNTYLDATGCKMVQTKAGSRLLTQPYDRYGYKKNKGFNSVHDITINGGTWVGTTKLLNSGVNVKNGQKTGTNVINFWHARNITIKNLTAYNVHNAHIIELCGVKNGKILNCTLGCRKVNGSMKKGYSSGDPYRGAVQLDFCSASGNRQSQPFDGTTCRNITIDGNYIWHKTAIQIANDSSKKTKTVKVKNNTFRCQHKWMPASMQKVTGFKAAKNKVVKY